MEFGIFSSKLVKFWQKLQNMTHLNEWHIENESVNVRKCLMKLSWRLFTSKDSFRYSRKRASQSLPKNRKQLEKVRNSFKQFLQVSLHLQKISFWHFFRLHMFLINLFGLLHALAIPPCPRQLCVAESVAIGADTDKACLKLGRGERERELEVGNIIPSPSWFRSQISASSKPRSLQMPPRESPREVIFSHSKKTCWMCGSLWNVL